MKSILYNQWVVGLLNNLEGVYLFQGGAEHKVPVVISKIFKDQVGKVLLRFPSNYCTAKLVKAQVITVCYPPTINTDYLFSST